MALEFPCSGCGELLRLSDEHAGKTARCPRCAALTPAPLAGKSGSAAAAESWELRTEDGTVFGPAPRSEIESWIAQGRVAPSHQARRAGTADWRPAGEVFPGLAGGSSPFSAPVKETPPSGPRPNPFADQAGNPYAPPVPVSLPPPSPRRPFLSPHRGGQILALGICGLCLCAFLGVAAWAMAAADLKEMNEGRMDPEGKGLTIAGMVLGIIATILWALSCAINILAAAAGG